MAFPSVRRLLVLFGRALLLKCPNCGGRPLHASWFCMREAPLLMVAFPILFFPFSKTVWLAFDLAFRPATAAELGGQPVERGRDGAGEGRPDGLGPGGATRRGTEDPGG